MLDAVHLYKSYNHGILCCALMFARNYPARIHHSCHRSQLCNSSSCGKTPVYHSGVWGKPAKRKTIRNEYCVILLIARHSQCKLGLCEISDNHNCYIWVFKAKWHFQKIYIMDIKTQLAHRCTAEYSLITREMQLSISIISIISPWFHS